MQAGHEPPHELATSVMFVMRRAVQLFAGYWADLVPELTPPQYSVLAALDAEDGLDQSQLGRLVMIDTATLTPLIVRLEQRGYLRRDIDPQNRRRKVLQITGGGRELVAAAQPRAREAELACLAPLDPDARAQMLKLLQEVTDGRSVKRLG